MTKDIKYLSIRVFTTWISSLNTFSLIFFCVKDFILYTFLERGREGERERKINMWWPLERPLLGTWVENQACDLIGNRPGDPLVHR